MHSCQDNKPFEGLWKQIINARRLYYLNKSAGVYENATYNKSSKGLSYCDKPKKGLRNYDIPKNGL